MSWIKLHKDLLDSYCFANPVSLKIWIWILMKANYKKSHVFVPVGNSGVTVEIDRGQMLFGRFKAEEELNIDGSTIYKQLKKLEKLEQIKLQPSNYYTIVTVLKFNDYQDIFLEEKEVTTVAQQSHNSRTTVAQQENTSIDVLEDIEYKENIEDAKPVIIEDVKLKDEPDYWRSACKGFLNDEKWKGSFCKSKGVALMDLNSHMNTFISNNHLSGKFMDEGGLKSYFLNYYNKYIKDKEIKNSGSTSSGFIETPNSNDYYNGKDVVKW